MRVCASILYNKHNMYRKDILVRKDEILRWIQEGRSKAWMSKELNCKSTTLEHALENFGVKYSGNIGARGFKKSPHRRDASEYFDNSKMISAHKLKQKLITDGYKKYMCESCGLSIWMGEAIPVELHHVDGNKYNNALENLKILCPNCHALTPNHAGKNCVKREANFCIDCRTFILPRSKRCSDCASNARKNKQSLK